MSNTARMERTPAIAKITRPKLPGIFPRARLFRLLDQGREKPVIWVGAPAGSGKTTLGASYLDARKLPCLWYQVDEGDGDIASFFYFMGLAAKKAAPRHKKPLPLLTPEYLQGVPVFTRRYFEELFNRLISSNGLNRSNRFCIVFDNFQDAPQESGFYEMMANALDTVPEGVNVVILSRTGPPSQFARLQANSRMKVIGWEDVRFTREESEELLGMKGEETTPDGMLTQLQEKTDGWAAGLILMMESGRRRGFQKGLHVNSHEEIFDYFANEIFNGTDKETRLFLLKTCFLPTITAPVAEKLTGISRSLQILSVLTRDHYFTDRRPLPEPVFQYHPLFREFLLAKAKEEFPESELSDTRRIAGSLLADSGNVEDAAGLFREAEAWEGLARLILYHAQSFVTEGRNKTLEAWIRVIPPDISGTMPWLDYWLGVCRLAYNPVEARGYFERAFARFRKEGDVSGLFLSWASIVDSFLYEWGDFKPLDAWLKEADNLIADYPEFSSREIEARFTAGMLNALTWRRPSDPSLPLWAEKAWTIVLHDPENSQLRIMLGSHLVFYHFWCREFTKAGLAIDLLRRVSASKAANHLTQLHWHAMEAIHSWLTADPAACLESVKEGLRIAEESGIHLLDLSIVAQGFLGGITLGDTSGLDDCLGKLSRINSQRILDKGLYAYLDALVAWHHGDVKKSIELGRLAVKFVEETGSPMPHSVNLIELAVSLFDGGQHEEAKKILKRGGDLARGMKMLEFTHLMHQARFAIDLGEEEQGLALLRQGLALGAQEGHVNMYRWNSGVMSRLCAKALEHGIEKAYVQKLIMLRKLSPPGDTICADAWPYPIRITTLGRFDVQRNGKPVTFAGKKKQLELLKALVALGGTSIREEQVTDLLWPDAEGDDSHNSFKMTLSRLRGLIGNEAVLHDEGLYSLNRGMIRTDAWVFERICDAAVPLWGGREESKDRVSEAAELTGKALVLYQGSFLPDAAGLGWTVSTRERLRSKLLRLTTSAGRHYEDKGKWKTAADYYERGLEADGLREEFYQRLIICYYKLGRPAEAAAVYNRCRSELAVLGIAPSRETMQIYESMK